MRQLLTKEDIAQYLTNAIRRDTGCDDLTVEHILPLAELDANGCNWSSAVKVKGSGISPNSFESQINEIIEAARSRFNVKPS